MLRALRVVIVVLGLVAGVVVTAPAAAAGQPDRTISWRSCAPADPVLQCGTLTVPLDWDQPRGKQIDLAVMRRLASDPGHRIGSMMVDPGGPGESGLTLVRESGADLEAWTDGRFDIVGWDPRGTNASSPVRCFTSSAEEARFWAGVGIPTTRAESQAYARKVTELAQRCGKVSGDLLDHISTADTARDLEALRVAVGDPKLTYTGLSYGSMIGQTYAALFPDRIRAMMLDGLVDPVPTTRSAEARTRNDVASTDESFAEFQRQCQAAGPAGCALAGHGVTVQQRVAGLLAAARKAPIPAPHADPPGALSYGDLLLSTFNPLRSPPGWPQFAKDLDAAAAGDASALETVARGMRSPEAYTAATTSAAISCLDGPASRPVSSWPSTVPTFTDSSSLWGPVLGWWLWAPCAANWPGRTDDAYRGPWTSTTTAPILLVNSRYDPATGYPNAVAAEKRFRNVSLVVMNGGGHPTYQQASACVDAARVRYLTDLVLPPKGTVCRPDEPAF
ncbi:alpha/beta hydrolase [Pseudonocardia ailaonensis]|uniref:Alpha/beta hydrolase n=1 Tax=Pseudonocardia ailaonensis TaxID=367279 RepID=A0ABN2NM15_9PSEU